MVTWRGFLAGGLGAFIIGAFAFAVGPEVAATVLVGVLMFGAAVLVAFDFGVDEP